MEDFLGYLNEIVEPTIKDFENNPTSTRHAFLACVTTFHAIDYLTYSKRPAHMRQKLRNRSQDFAIVDRVAHAFKHVDTRDPDQPLESTDVIPRAPAIWGEAQWDLSR